jgi:hypothetical protein
LEFRYESCGNFGDNRWYIGRLCGDDGVASRRCCRGRGCTGSCKVLEELAFDVEEEAPVEDDNEEVEDLEVVAEVVGVVVCVIGGSWS